MTQSLVCPQIFWLNHLTLGAKWSKSWSVHLTATCSSWLCFTSTQASRWHYMPPPVPAQTPIGFWGPNLRNHSTQITKPPWEAYLLRLLHDLDTCHCCPQPPNHYVLQHLCLTWSTTVFTFLVLFSWLVGRIEMYGAKCFSIRDRNT
jgi:hypothetical protein